MTPEKFMARAIEIGREGAHDHRVQATPIEDVVLDDHMGMKESGTCS